MAIRLQATLQDFAARGITADKLTAEEITSLVYACDRVDNPFSDVNAELLGEPVKVCEGLYLWPITAGAQIWLTEYAEKWWKRGSAMYRWAQIYALHNARNREAFSGLTTCAKARVAVLRCLLRFTCHRAELMEAINRCYGVRPHDTEPKRNPRKTEMADDLASLVASLEVYSGLKADHWLWGRSLDLMVKDYCRLRSFSAALGGGAKMEFELDSALENLARVKAAIMEAHLPNE